VVDRLDKAGYARRKADPSDRRRVLVEPTEKAMEAAAAIYGPLGEGQAKLEKYSEKEIEAMIAFLEIATEVTDKQSARLREGR
jgi:DNA-binding MarR family transcriptional regulator